MLYTKKSQTKFSFILFRAKASSKDSKISSSKNAAKERPKSWHASKHDNSLTASITSQLHRNSGEISSYKMKSPHTHISNLLNQQKLNKSRGWKESGDLIYKGSRDSLLSNHNSAISSSSKMSLTSSG